MSVYIEGNQIYNGFINAAIRLEEKKDMLNALNLFPVADKDTGTNMAITMKKTAQSMLPAKTPKDVVEDAFLNLLEYSHGNSGTILTLFFEGFKNSIPFGQHITGSDFAHAIECGAKAAYEGVMEPKPGTILTVASRSASAGVSMLEITNNVGEIVKRIVDEAHAALMQTPFQNPTLKPHMVVDSGALGFCLILDGFLSGIWPEAKIDSYPPLKLPDSAVGTACQLPFRYCTELVISLNEGVSKTAIMEEIKPQGEYFVMSSSDSLCKVHIHTNEPEKVINQAEQFGRIKSSKVDDMLKQI